MFDLLDIRLGNHARRRIEREGLKPGDIRCVPAAAGGPKGLALLPFDAEASAAHARMTA